MGSHVAQCVLNCYVAEVSLTFLISPLPPECRGVMGVYYHTQFGTIPPDTRLFSYRFSLLGVYITQHPV